MKLENKNHHESRMVTMRSQERELKETEQEMINRHQMEWQHSQEVMKKLEMKARRAYANMLAVQHDQKVNKEI